jgi:hypothetical protein
MSATTKFAARLRADIQDLSARYADRPADERSRIVAAYLSVFPESMVKEALGPASAEALPTELTELEKRMAREAGLDEAAMLKRKQERAIERLARAPRAKGKKP